MRTWTFLLGGLVVWAAHFFLLYGIASVFPGTSLALWLSLVATIPAVAADAALLWLAASLRLRHGSDELRNWTIDLGAVGAALSLVAVLWQALPAIVVQWAGPGSRRVKARREPAGGGDGAVAQLGTGAS